MRGNTTDDEEHPVDLRVPGVLREVAERLVLRKLEGLLVVALLGLVLLEASCLWVLATRKPRVLYVPESTLLVPVSRGEAPQGE